MKQALAHLNQLIALGAEFPAAVYDTCVAYSLNAGQVKKLELAYDQQFQ